MNNASLELGGTNWAEKDGNILGYSVGDTSGNFSPQEFTFARGSNLSATRIDRAGLIVKGRENVLLYSNQFDTTWGSATSTLTSGQAGYDGTNDAWKLSKNQANAQINQSSSSTSVKIFSLYAKADTLNWIAIVAASGSIAYFNLSNGVIGTTGGSVIKANAESIGNGWYRCSVSSAATTSSVTIYPADGDGNISGSSGSIYIQDAQVELGLTASPYIETTTTSAQAGVLENTPRLNYTTGVANPYLLLEPSRTNLVTNSEYISGDWNIQNITDVSNTSDTLSPEGFYNSTKLTATSIDPYIFKIINVDVGDNTFSFYVKGTGSTVGKESRILFWYLGTATGTQSSHSFTLTSEWQRIEATTAVTGAGTLAFRIDLPADVSVIGDSCYLYGLQLEAGSYSTSYIPTYSVSATRAQDTSSKADASGEINSTEGVWYAEIAALANDGTYRQILLHDNSYLKRIALRYMPTSNQIDVYLNNSTVQAQFSYVLTNALDFNKIAFKYKENDFALWVNGIEVGTDTSGTTFPDNTLEKIDFDFTNNYFFYGKVNALQVYKEALTDAELATLTTI